LSIALVYLFNNPTRNCALPFSATTVSLLVVHSLESLPRRSESFQPPDSTTGINYQTTFSSGSFYLPSPRSSS